MTVVGNEDEAYLLMMLPKFRPGTLPWANLMARLDGKRRGLGPRASVSPAPWIGPNGGALPGANRPRESGGSGSRLPLQGRDGFLTVPDAVPSGANPLAGGSFGLGDPSAKTALVLGTAAVGAVAVAGGAAALGYAASKRRRKSSGSRRRSTARGPRRKKRVSAYRGAGGKRRNRRGGAVKDRYKGKKVYRTKRGQPYVLMANGKARFVKA